jgi:dimeric dUTPase (all-alpha-NTP-PPase superfamily)
VNWIVISKTSIQERNGQAVIEKVLALLVELGELANETRCFKFWSDKPASERKVTLEEYVDCLHFVLSIGLEMDVELINIVPIKKKNVIEQFTVLFNAVTILKIHFAPFVYNHVFSAFIGLGEMLGFTWEEIENAYLEKNAVNHKRQEESY